jgi:hypothetical protein
MGVRMALLRVLVMGFFTLACLSGSPAHAGAWTQKKGDLQLITTTNIYTADRFFDTRGNTRKQLNFTKQEISAYAEYGLQDGLTIGGQLPFARAEQELATRSATSFNVGDSEMFLRKRLWQDNLNVVSLQPSIIFPSPDSKATVPKIGSDHPSAGLRSSYGRNFEALGKWHYADIEAAYIYRFGQPSDQLKLDVTVGFNMTEKWQIIPQAFITRSTKRIKTATFTQSFADDYNLVKVQLSVQYSFTPASAVQLGAFGHIDGKNTGAGRGITASYVRSF